MNRDYFSSFNQINKITRNKKKIFLFGYGFISEKTMAGINTKVHGIFDNSKNLQNNTQDGIQILDPKNIKKLNYEEIYVIITTTSFKEVSEQLIEYGLEINKNFSASPLLKDLLIIDEIQSVKQELIFSSGAPAEKNENYGGGLYRLTINEDSWSYKKIYSGNCYGIINGHNNKTVFIDKDNGIIELDNNFKKISQHEIKSNTRPHGISYSDKYKKYYISCSNLDAVLVLDQNFKLLKEIKFSGKWDFYKKAQHHCNDCCVDGMSLYVSMFSISGNWKKDIYDGGILEIDLEQEKVIGSLCNNLWMPHNVSIIDGNMHVLDSLKGNLLTNNLSIVGNFPAFTRGLAFDGSMYYVGQSRNRNFSKNLGISKNISVDAGIVIFDPLTKVSRFIQLNQKISEIHHIKLI